MVKKTIAVIFGGRSVEHDVSIITAHIPIIPALVASGQFDILPIYIAKDGSWYADAAMSELDFFKRPDLEERLAHQKKTRLLFDGGLKIVWPGIRPRVRKIDIVFPAMHGTFGEDGSLMGLLRMAGVPFVGCDLFASAISMDKVLTKQVLAAEGVPVVPFVWFNAAEWERDRISLRQRIEGLRWPLFVKPAHLGSSIGIAKIREPRELANAVEVAFHYDDKVLVEESVEDLIEVTLPMMGNDVPTFAEVERPLNKTEFFNFEDKYLSNGKKGAGAENRYSEIPAKIGDDLAKRVRGLAAKAWRAIGCSGIARIDFLIDRKAGEVFVNEVNTLPGSLYHHNWRQAGVSNVELVTKLVTLAEERFRAEERITRTFSSEILAKVRGAKTDGRSRADGDGG